MFKSTCFLAFATAIGVLSLYSPNAPAQEVLNADETDVACPDEPQLRKKPRQVRDLTTWVVLISHLELQGKNNFRLRYVSPDVSCEKDRIESIDGTANVLYSPYKPGLETVLYRVILEEMPESREIAVLYTGIFSAVRNRGEHFYIAESRGIRTNFYAMYKDQPRYDAIRTLLADIVNGKATTLIAVEWPKGSDDALIVEIDERLK